MIAPTHHERDFIHIGGRAREPFNKRRGMGCGDCSGCTATCSDRQGMGDASTDPATDPGTTSSLTDFFSAQNFEHLITAGVAAWILYRAFFHRHAPAPAKKRRSKKKKQSGFASLIPSFA